MSSTRRFAASILYLEGVSEADKVPLHEVVRTAIGNDICRLGEYPDVGSKAIFKFAAKVAQHAIRAKVLAERADAVTCESDVPGHTCGIGPD